MFLRAQQASWLGKCSQMHFSWLHLLENDLELLLLSPDEAEKTSYCISFLIHKQEMLCEDIKYGCQDNLCLQTAAAPPVSLTHLP